MKNVLVGLYFFLLCGTLAAQQGDERILAAREALRSNDGALLEHLATQREDHPLDHYVPYWLLLHQLDRAGSPPAASIATYIQTHQGSVPASRLASAWARYLADENDWGSVSQLLPNALSNAETRCLDWRSRHALGDTTALDEIAAQWETLDAAHTACEPVLAAAVTSGRIDENAAWQRFRRQIDSRRPAASRATLEWMGLPQAREIDRLIADPAAYFDQLPANFNTARAGREMAIAALVRMARKDETAAAYIRMLKRETDFLPAERAYLYASFGYLGALSRLPQSNEWFAHAGDITMSPLQREWRVRAALRAEDWAAVERAISRLTTEEQSQEEWIYWHARALEQLGQKDAARQHYARIADRYGYYGMLAADELGQPFPAPASDEEVSRAERSRVAADPGIARALTFYRIGLPVEGVREWVAAVHGRDRSFLVAAAHIARDQDLHDRAINTAELADPTANFNLRFPTPWRDLIEPHAQARNIDPAWVYGLMRQESRFNIPARSGAGARGLMQVMPGTGQLVARKIGMQNFHTGMLNDPRTNVQLGTHYLRMLLDDLDGNEVLAAAGYNAGPGRAKRWRADEPLDATIYIATIPINETRDYVEKVFVNEIVYSALFSDRPQSLKERLKTIFPERAPAFANR